MNAVADSPEYPEIYALSQPQRSEPHSQVKNATLDLQQQRILEKVAGDLSTTGRLRDTTTSTAPQNANNQCFHAVNENVQNRQNLWPRPAKRHRYTIPDKMFPSPNGEQPAYPGYESGVVKRDHQELRPRLH
ncbi:hypothetical protein F4823DRAFT_566800 [Ustulina deusta]|nr:hypothetical protein F4823DRAFT_566800 [Ustulina deusta]